MKKYAIAKQSLSLVSAALFLVACGDTINEQINANVGAVDTSEDLPKCTKDIAGQTAFVTETHEFLGCDGKEWLTLSANTVSVGDNICTSTSLSDGTGFEIFCNGESIGTVKNGKDGKDGADGEDGADGKNGKDGKNGADGKDGKDGEKGDPGADGKDGEKGDQGDPGKDGVNGTGCRIAESTALTATIACGSETFTMDLTGYVEQSEECDATLYGEDCSGSLDNVELSGVSQKGPFVTGTDITAYELENGRSLKQTGKTFGGKIERADGTFDIKTVKLKSAFAYLVADGFYRNEVTGENSAATIKLRALTNLQGRATANINLITHLEYDRVQYLVTREDSTVMKAKKAAEKEIFEAFDIDNSGFKGYAEDFNILEEGDGNAALLAISALLQGDRNESELTALLASLSVDLGDNGKWDNEKQRAQIADWAMQKQLSKEGLASIRKNVEGWFPGKVTAPAFESHMTHFWMEELEVDDCTSANEGALFAIKNKKSAFYAASDSAYTEGDSSLVRLICDASGAWRYATDIEKDIAALAPAADNAATRGSINTGFVYVNENGDWRRGTELDMTLDSSCVAAITNHATFTADGSDTTWYICASNREILGNDTISTSWRLAKEAEADTALFGVPATAEDSIKLGHANKGHFYVYENDAWRRGTETDFLLGKACLASMKGEIFVDGAGQYFTCTNEKKILADGVIDTSTWRLSTAIEADKYGWAIPTTFADSVKLGNIDKSHVYVYENDAWRYGTELDIDGNLGPCTEDKVGNVAKSSKNVWFKCVDDGNTLVEGEPVPTEWREATNYEKDTYGLEGEFGDYQQGKVNQNLYYVREDGYWRPATDLEMSGLESCTQEQENKISPIEAGYYKCTKEFGTVVDTFKVEYTWRKATDIEKDLTQLPSSAANGAVRSGPVNPNMYYVFQDGKWRYGTALDDLLGEACKKNGDTSSTTYNALYYVCTDQVASDTIRKWVPAPDIYNDTYEARGECNINGEYGEGHILIGRVNTQKAYVCDADTFRLANSSEISRNKGCVSYTQNYIIKHNGSFNKCTSLGWTAAVDLDTGIVKDAAGQIYKTVVIDNQQWMAENLNYEMEGSTSASRGRYYSWNAALRACMDGWHLPSDAEFNMLIGRANGYALSLVSEKWPTLSSSVSKNSLKFSALPSVCSGCSSLESAYTAYFWSSTPKETYLVYAFYIELSKSASSSGYSRLTSLSPSSQKANVRCVQN